MERFFKNPKLDAPLSQVTKRSLLKKAWEANSASLGPALSATCVARNTISWMEKITKHLAQVKSQDLQDTLSIIGKAVAYLADAAAVESMVTSAKTGALINLVRRAIWLKEWEGYFTSKAKLCGLPF